MREEEKENQHMQPYHVAVRLGEEAAHTASRQFARREVWRKAESRPQERRSVGKKSRRQKCPVATHHFEVCRGARRAHPTRSGEIRREKGNQELRVDIVEAGEVHGEKRQQK